MAFVLADRIEKIKYLEDIALKTCGGCKAQKDNTLFSKDRTRPDGLYPLCKTCRSPKNSDYRKRIAEQNKLVPLEKTCACCKSNKASSEFKTCKNNLDGLYSYCTNCDKAKRQVLRYRWAYGFSKEEAETFAQNNIGKCQICKVDGKLFVDHCHATGKVRGFVCNACNLILGFAKDNSNTLKAAAEYLEGLR